MSDERPMTHELRARDWTSVTAHDVGELVLAAAQEAEDLLSMRIVVDVQVEDQGVQITALRPSRVQVTSAQLPQRRFRGCGVAGEAESPDRATRTIAFCAACKRKIAEALDDGDSRSQQTAESFGEVSILMDGAM